MQMNKKNSKRSNEDIREKGRWKKKEETSFPKMYWINCAFMLRTKKKQKRNKNQRTEKERWKERKSKAVFP